MPRDQFHANEVPSKPGVYIFRDRFGTVIYVGKAANLRRRVSSYFRPSTAVRGDAKLRSLINSIHSWSFEVVRNEDEALILESRLIKSFAPHYNILMRDDKRYLLLRLDRKERFPTLKLARVKRNDDAEYFGPFPKGGALKATLEFLLRRFGLRLCRTSEPDAETRKRCLGRMVKDCCAPCVGAVSDTEYRERLEAALAVLSGDISGLLGELDERMRSASDNNQFEKAAHWRDVHDSLQAVFGSRTRNFEKFNLGGHAPGPESCVALQQRLGLPAVPDTIVCFDISNIMGQLAVASLVAFKSGRPDKANYRRLRIRTVTGSDDFAMMSEAVGRYFSRLLREGRPLPDLLMVDGGKGQLSSAVSRLVELGCPPFPVIGLAKRNEEIFLPGRSEPVVLDRHDPALRMLQALRDEAHRFAISFHRELRDKRLTESLLDDIPNVGKVRKTALLKEFGSLRAIKRATAQEIAARVPGIGETLAGEILASLHVKP